MKLFNFIYFEPFNKVKERMGIPRDELGSIKPITISKSKLPTVEDIKLKTVGIEVNINEVKFLEDGTLGYKDRRVLLYIGDVKYVSWGTKSSKDPRFHISACKMLLQMKSAGRFQQKYVVATREDGLFPVHYIGSGAIVPDKKLNICQYCLGHIKYKGFTYSKMTEKERRFAVDSFSIAEFFDKYPKSLQPEVPLHNDITAPTNTYPSNFNEISKAYRNKIGWVCEKCLISLKDENLHRYLHVHHKDGGQHNNVDSNLEALCIYCHSEEPMHSHMKRTIMYKEFMDLYYSKLNTQPHQAPF